MVSPESEEIVRRGTQIYEERLRTQLEATHRNWFVAIEPTSGDYFLGRKFLEAADAARSAHPDRYPVVLRIGHDTTFELVSVLTYPA
jgi:hypothetical protein